MWSRLHGRLEPAAVVKRTMRATTAEVAEDSEKSTQTEQRRERGRNGESSGWRIALGARLLAPRGARPRESARPGRERPCTVWGVRGRASRTPSNARPCRASQAAQETLSP